MALPQVRASLSTLSGTAKIGIGAGILAILLVVGFGVSWWNGRTIANLRKEAAELKQENVRLSDSYNQALGIAKANEQLAREEKMKADALIATIEAGTKNVKLLDDKLAQVEKTYDEAKANLGDCADNPDCINKLRDELCAAGFKLPDCPKR